MICLSLPNPNNQPQKTISMIRNYIINTYSIIDQIRYIHTATQAVQWLTRKVTITITTITFLLLTLPLILLLIPYS